MDSPGEDIRLSVVRICIISELVTKTVRDHSSKTRHDWSQEEVSRIYHQPLLELVRQASQVHGAYHDSSEVQVCTLLSVKTGGCPEDCVYCSQAARYDTEIHIHRLLSTEEVVDKARKAKEAGATRFCMGAAWRQVKENQDFDHVLEMVRRINEMGLEVCCTLGMLTSQQARRLKAAGLYAYNHNLDTSREFYSKIITTRTFEDRLRTIDNVRRAGISVCCGGIIGMGESEKDRIGMLHTLATLDQHPESVPINVLVPVKGTPLERMPRVSVFAVVRMVAATRILMPRAMVRLSAGRLEISQEGQALCFLAGANSIFSGEELLTTPNPGMDQDRRMFELLGLRPRQAFRQ